MILSGSSLVKPYEPRRFGRDYCELASTGQYPMFVACALGIKPLFDDWIRADKYEEYEQVIAEYGLLIEPDVVFVEGTKIGEVIGSENLATTHHTARSFSSGTKEGDVHVFVSKSRELLVEAKKFGWYPVITGNRSINKPFIDHLRFGGILGYPECCVEFFRRYNDWNRYSHPFEALKNTKGAPSYRCNNFLMDSSYSLIHHLPCSYDCQKTIELAKRVDEAIEDVEPGFSKATSEMLKKPLLVFNEKNFIIFDGELMEGNGETTITYSACQYFSNPSRPNDNIGFFEEVLQGDNMSINDSAIEIRKGGERIMATRKKPEWFVIGFG